MLSVGATPAAHFTLAGQVTVPAAPEAGWRMSISVRRMNPFAPLNTSVFTPLTRVSDATSPNCQNTLPWNGVPKLLALDGAQQVEPAITSASPGVMLPPDGSRVMPSNAAGRKFAFPVLPTPGPPCGVAPALKMLNTPSALNCDVELPLPSHSRYGPTVPAPALSASIVTAKWALVRYPVPPPLPRSIAMTAPVLLPPPWTLPRNPRSSPCSCAPPVTLTISMFASTTTTASISE